MKTINHELELAKKETIKFWQRNKDYVQAILVVALIILLGQLGIFK
jgi:hypothetical protein